MESARSIGNNIIDQINTLVGRLANLEGKEVIPDRFSVGPYIVGRNGYGWYVYHNTNTDYYLRSDYTFQHDTNRTSENSGYFKSVIDALNALFTYRIKNPPTNSYIDHTEELSKNPHKGGSFYAITIPLTPGNHKIPMIKMYREFTCAGLKFSKESVEANKYWFPCETVARVFFAAVWKDGIIADLSAWATVPND